MFLLSNKTFLYKFTYYCHFLFFFCYFFISVRSYFFVTFCVFLCIITYILIIATVVKKMSLNEIRKFIFEKYYKQIGFSNECSNYSMKYLKKKKKRLLLLAKKLKYLKKYLILVILKNTINDLYKNRKHKSSKTIKFLLIILFLLLK